MKNFIKRIAIIAIVIAAISSYGWYNQTTTERTLIGPYPVLFVIDGDTIVIERAGREERLRLIGIDTPEHDEAYFDEAKNFTADLVANKAVFLELGQAPTDKYNRTLCYVYLEDKTSMVNQLIAKAGWAEILTIQPNDKYETLFKKAVREAIANGRGMY